MTERLTDDELVAMRTDAEDTALDLAPVGRGWILALLGEIDALRAERDEAIERAEVTDQAMLCVVARAEEAEASDEYNRDSWARAVQRVTDLRARAESAEAERDRLAAKWDAWQDCEQCDRFQAAEARITAALAVHDKGCHRCKGKGYLPESPMGSPWPCPLVAALREPVGEPQPPCTHVREGGNPHAPSWCTTHDSPIAVIADRCAWAVEHSVGEPQPEPCDQHADARRVEQVRKLAERCISSPDQTDRTVGRFFLAALIVEDEQQLTDESPCPSCVPPTTESE